MKRTQVRQGDVLLVPVSKIPTDAKLVKPDNGRVILAYGEVTGHAHAIDETVAKLFEVSGVGDRYLDCADGAVLRHEEHGAHPLKGKYRVVRQREYDLMGEIRRVAD